MLKALADRWWLILLRGIAAIIFGILAISVPHITLWTLILLFAILAVFEGIVSIAAGLTGGAGSYRWWEMVLIGLVGVLAGIVAFTMPGLTALVLLYIIAFWAIFQGIFEIVAAIRLRKVISNEWALALAGVLAIVFGLFILVRPGAGALAVVFIIGTYAIIHGIVLIVVSMRLHGMKNRLEGGTPATV
ncbi:MAG TPA: HdeD family acid-resistance protein [Tepidisphaeraceae bacterium]|jgi:uncharacterized membrane protein HdeD (DUF308 family)